MISPSTACDTDPSATTKTDTSPTVSRPAAACHAAHSRPTAATSALRPARLASLTSCPPVYLLAGSLSLSQFAEQPAAEEPAEAEQPDLLGRRQAGEQASVEILAPLAVADLADQPRLPPGHAALQAEGGHRRGKDHHCHRRAEHHQREQESAQRDNCLHDPDAADRHLPGRGSPGLPGYPQPILEGRILKAAQASHRGHRREQLGGTGLGDRPGQLRFSVTHGAGQQRCDAAGHPQPDRQSDHALRVAGGQVVQECPEQPGRRHRGNPGDQGRRRLDRELRPPCLPAAHARAQQRPRQRAARRWCQLTRRPAAPAAHDRPAAASAGNAAGSWLKAMTDPAPSSTQNAGKARTLKAAVTSPSCGSTHTGATSARRSW